MNVTDALAALGTDPVKAVDLARYHKVDRPYLGIAAAAVDAVVRDWRNTLDLDTRLALAADLWASDVHEGRIAAAKLLTQARIRPDDTEAWAMIRAWVPQCDTLPIADAVGSAGQKRLVADPARLDQLAIWVRSDSAMVRRAVLVLTAPWTKMNTPKPADLAQRDIVLGWVASLAADPDNLVQGAVTDWLGDLARHDKACVQAFAAGPGAALKPFYAKSLRRKLA